MIHRQPAGNVAQWARILNHRSINVPPVLRFSNTAPAASPPARRDAPRSGDQEMANFDLREALAGITVRETTFGEFLAAIKQAGRKPA